MTNSNYCEIYEISVMVDGKIHNHFYIGQSWPGAKIRFAQHKSDKDGDCPKLFNAMDKYGRENFLCHALVTVKTQEDADYYEDYFINQYDSIKNGYNIKEAGSCGKHSEETKKKLSERPKITGKDSPLFGKPGLFLGRTHTPESLKKMGESQSGENNARFGVALKDETKIKISNALKGRKDSQETKNKKSKAKKGKNNPSPHSQSTKDKIGKANKGRVKSKVTCEKLSKANKGKKRSEKTKQRMREAHVLRKLNKIKNGENNDK